MTAEQLDEIEKLAEARLRVGDALADRLLLTVKALREAWADMATIQRLAEAGLNDESISEICALDDIYSVTRGLPLEENS